MIVDAIILMSFRLTICPLADQKLLENFPNDPYADIEIATQTLNLQLSLAYLAIDSHFFAKISPENNKIDLSYLKEQPLVYVLRALYGGELQCSSVGELCELYKIIDVLQIEEYKNNISKSLLALHKEKPEASPFSSIELTQFCLTHEILREQALQFHLSGRLQLLESSKNYLQLGKLSDANVNMLLVGLIEKEGERADNIINHILENYFNRKGCRPIQYFNKYTIQPLIRVWQKFHHKMLFRMPNHKLQKAVSSTQIYEDKTYQSQIAFNPKFNHMHSANIASQIFTNFKSPEEKKVDYQLQTLMRELESKNKRIEVLRGELKELLLMKDQQQKKKKEVQTSMELLTVGRSRKSKELAWANMGADNSMNESEVAFKFVKKAVEQDKAEGGKLRLGKHKKIFH